ncbi:MAG: 2-oxo acid dehydrogenase subunit E2 [archaeon]
MLNLSLSFDHRIIDGADAARFMNDIMVHLEDPAMMLVDSI